MALETGTYISDLVSTNPVSNDPKNAGDDHLRLLKATIKATFPNISGAVTATHAELNYVDGVTSAIQTQIDTKAPLASPSLTGAPTAPTPGVGDNSTKIATTEFVVTAALNASLPGQTSKTDYLLSTDGSNANWDNTINPAVVTLSTGGSLVGTTATQSLSGKTLTTPIFQDSSDNTKKANLVLSGVTAGQNRSITVEDRNTLLMTPGWVYLSTVTASNSATVDVETTLNSTYISYVIVFENVKLSTTNLSLLARAKIAGSYHSGAADYQYFTTLYEGTPTTTNGATGSSSMLLTANIDGSDTARLISGRMYVSDPANTNIRKRFQWEMMFKVNNTGNPGLVIGHGTDNSGNGAVTGVRFLASSGNIVSGDFRLFGIRGA